MKELRADSEDLRHSVEFLSKYDDNTKVKVYDVLDEENYLIENEYIIQNLNYN